MKNKGLEALKEIKSCSTEYFIKNLGYLFDRVETELKRLEGIDNSPKIILGRHHGQTKSMIDYVCKNWKEVKITNLEDEKKLKALEIIKKKKWLVEDILNAFFEDKEQYDLLKEVLL